MGLPDVEIRTWVRTGDTPQAERSRMRRRPPHILVTTPESLYVLLGSESGRAMLATARTVIVDEIHAVAPNKRGAHLALSLERLAALCGDKLQRIGLSATQKPIETVASFLVGSGADGRPAADVKIVDAGHHRARDLAIELPDSPLAAVMSNDVWTEVYERLAELIEAHRTTLVFVNTRRMAERVARQLTEAPRREPPSPPITAAWRRNCGSPPSSGSSAASSRRWSRPRRSNSASTSATSILSASSARRARSRPSCSASAAPATRSAARRRAGSFRCRATTSSSASALLDSVRRGELDRLAIPERPLDVLAQQIVAEVAGAGLAGGQLFRARAPRVAVPRARARGL